MYGAIGTPQHQLGVQVIEAAEKACRTREVYVMVTLTLPDSRECVARVYRPTPARKPDPKAP